MTSSIVFDLDGTLVDSAPDLHAAANRMLSDCGEAPLDLATITRFVGNGIPHLVGLIMQERGLPDDQSAKLNALMLSHYTAHPADLTVPYPGVVSALEALTDAGHHLGICTNKFRAPSIQILEALDLMRFFPVVIGGDSLPVIKPDPAPLHAAFEALGSKPLLYVGDSEVDAETAQNAGMAFGLYTLGYRKTPVEDLSKTFIFDDFADLPRLVHALV